MINISKSFCSCRYYFLNMGYNLSYAHNLLCYTIYRTKPDSSFKYKLAVWDLLYFECTLDCNLAFWKTTAIPSGYAGNAGLADIH